MRRISRRFTASSRGWIPSILPTAITGRPPQCGWGRNGESSIRAIPARRSSIFFLSVLFPDHQLMIMPYNRVVKDLNGLSKESFYSRIARKFDVVKRQRTPLAPGKKGEFAMFLSQHWYLCRFRQEDLSEITDPVEALDVSLLQNLLLEPILGITDPRTDERIDFVGGIRGLSELERRCRTDCRVAFALYPTSIQELFAVADAAG